MEEADPDASTLAGEVVPISPRIPSFFPPDAATHTIPPPAISGEYPAVQIEALLLRRRASARPPNDTTPMPLSIAPLSIESIPPPGEKTFNIRPKRLGNDGWLDLGWVFGLAFFTGCIAFTWLWFVLRWLVR